MPRSRWILGRHFWALADFKFFVPQKCGSEVSKINLKGLLGGSLYEKDGYGRQKEPTGSQRDAKGINMLAKRIPNGVYFFLWRILSQEKITKWRTTWSQRGAKMVPKLSLK